MGQDLARSEHDLHIIKKGFKSIMRHQTEWVKTTQKVEEQQKEIERLKMELLRTQQQNANRMPVYRGNDFISAMPRGEGPDHCC